MGMLRASGKENNCQIKCSFFWHLLERHKNYEGWNFNSGNYLFTTDTK